MTGTVKNAKNAVKNYLSKHGPTQEEGVGSTNVVIDEPNKNAQRRGYHSGGSPSIQISLVGDDEGLVEAAAERLVTKLRRAGIEPRPELFVNLQGQRVSMGKNPPYTMHERKRKGNVIGHVAMVQIDTSRKRSFADLAGKFKAATQLYPNGLTPDQDEALDGLTSRKRPLSLDILMDENHEPTEFLAALIKNELVGELFTEELWKGKSARELTDFYQALPESAQECISNFHQLTTAISRKETAQTRVR